jgi:ATP-dependent protease Clp ATPase subunit
MQAIARRALERKTGARGLRSILVSFRWQKIKIPGRGFLKFKVVLALNQTRSDRFLVFRRLI